MTERTVIDTPEGLADAVDRIAAGSGPVAIDVERASGFRYSQRAYLVQLFRRGVGVVLFDPPPIGDFSALQDAIADEEWVLHASTQDLPSLRELGLNPSRMFDTELAARLLGWEKVGLAAVVENVSGVSLAKAHSAADWSTRPLPAEWLEYAAEDVEYLVDARDALAAELSAAGKEEFAREEFAAILERPPKPPRAEPWRRLSGLHKIRGGRNLAVARALWTARDEYARAEDVSPGRLVPDRALVAAVLAAPRSKSELAAVKDFTGRASRSQLDRWWAAIEEGRRSGEPPADRLGADGPPPPRAWAARAPEADARLKQARAAVEERAGELGMPTENLLTPDTIRRLCWDPPGSGVEEIAAALRDLGAREWQIAQTAPVISAAFVRAAQAASETREDVS